MTIGAFIVAVWFVAVVAVLVRQYLSGVLAQPDVLDEVAIAAEPAYGMAHQPAAA